MRSVNHRLVHFIGTYSLDALRGNRGANVLRRDDSYGVDAAWLVDDGERPMDPPKPSQPPMQPPKPAERPPSPPPHEAPPEKQPPGPPPGTPDRPEPSKPSPGDVWRGRR